MGGAHHGNALVGGISSQDGHAIVCRGQVGFAMGFDGQAAHDVDVRSEAVPSIGVQELHGRATHDVDSGVDQNQGRLVCCHQIIRVLADAKHLHRGSEGSVARVVSERVLAPSIEALANQSIVIAGRGNIGRQGSEQAEDQTVRCMAHVQGGFESFCECVLVSGHICHNEKRWCMNRPLRNYGATSNSLLSMSVAKS
jgi:hypothetical protein